MFACASWHREGRRLLWWCAGVMLAGVSTARAVPPGDGPYRHAFERDEILVGLPEPFVVRGLLTRKADGTIEGFAIDVTRAAANAVGLECVFQPLEDLAPLEGLRAGRVDVEVPVSILESRLNKASFTAPILITRGVVFRAETTSSAKTVEALRGRRVAVARAGIGHQWCKERGIECLPCNTLGDTLAALTDGRADYVITTEVAGRFEAERVGLKGVVWDELDDEQFTRAFALATTASNGALESDLNKGLSIIRDNGTYDRLFDRWVAPYQRRTEREAGVPMQVAEWATLAVVGTGAGGLAWHVTLRRALSRRTRELREREEQYLALANNVPGLMYSYFVGDGGRREVRFENSAAAAWRERFPWLNPGSDYRSTILERIHPDDRERYDAATLRARENTSVFDVEFRLRSVEGSYRWLHSVVVPVATDGGVIWQGLLLDVTALREAVAEVSRSRRRYQEIFERSHDAIVVFRPSDGTVLEANRRACELYGCERHDLVGVALARAVPGPVEEACRGAGATEGGGVREARVRQSMTDGRELWVDLSASEIEYDGQPAVLTLMRDVTERVRAEEHHRQMEVRLQQSERLESLGLLAGGIAHDFNNLLVGILGNAELARVSADRPEDLARVTGAIVHSAQRAAELTQQLLAYAGRARLVSEPVALAELGRETALLLGPRLSTGASIEFVEASDGAMTRGDPTQLRQVVMNLLTNASDALVAGEGRIVVTTGHGEFTREQLGGVGTDPGHYAFIEVRDEGCGMSESTVRRMFDPFFTTKPQGRGLGLAATLRTVQRHRGTITVKSRLGQGTTVRVFLPWSERGAVAVEFKPGTPATRGAVIVIDDEPAVREVAIALLRMAGWSGRVAAGGEEAVKALESGESADVVLMDLTMPGLSGPRLISEIRRVRPDLPVVVMTGYSIEAAGAGLDADGHVAKPFSSGALDTALSNAMHARRAHQGTTARAA